ncbi:DUF6326 family protein [Candidatus Leptofilum sp.]|uniref:DUF6326 family protein n=1 Tax=Candidatus Leptofilum sp. TaxID=3241576 RepID=UPI003B5CE359
MNSNEKITKTDAREKISLLWVVVMFNMAFADIVGFVHPGSLEDIIAGNVGFELTQGLLLLFSILIEIPIAMIFLSRILNDTANRRLNIFAAILTAIFVIGGGSATLSYVFFASIEVLCMGLIAWYAWQLPKRASAHDLVQSENVVPSAR